MLVSAMGILAVVKVRKIHSLQEFLLGAGVTIAGYLWIFVALTVKSPGRIDIVEAVATLLGFATYMIANNMLER